MRGAATALRARVGGRAARAYVAGPELSDAVAMCRRLAGRGVAADIGFWNGGEAPRAVADAYLAALGAIGWEDLDGCVSVKLPALASSGELVTELLQQSRRHAVPLRFDALGIEHADAVLGLIEGALPHPSGLGCTLPARWARSVADAEAAVEWGIGVRLVKGEYADEAGGDVDPRRGFLTLADRLAGRAGHVIVATHDGDLAREALARLRAAGTPCELELLLGLPPQASIRAAREAGVGVRAYVPYGCARLPYRLSEAGRNPAVLWWLACDLLHGEAFRVPGQTAAGAPPRNGSAGGQ